MESVTDKKSIKSTKSTKSKKYIDDFYSKQFLERYFK